MFSLRSNVLLFIIRWNDFPVSFLKDFILHYFVNSSDLVYYLP